MRQEKQYSSLESLWKWPVSFEKYVSGVEFALGEFVLRYSAMARWSESEICLGDRFADSGRRWKSGKVSVEAFAAAEGVHRSFD